MDPHWDSLNLEDIVSRLSPDDFDADAADKWIGDLQKQSSKASQELEAKENDGILEMRKRWSNWVLIFIAVIIGFDIVLVSLYGLGIWKFDDSNIVIVVITDNFLKIVGLGYLIARKIFIKIYGPTEKG